MKQQSQPNEINKKNNNTNNNNLIAHRKEKIDLMI